MNETELERLIVRLVGNADSYLKMLKEAEQGTAHAAKQIDEATKKIEGIKGALESVGGVAARALGAAGLGFSLEEAFSKFEEAEKNVIKLETTLRSNEREVGSTMKAYKDFSAEISNMTMQSKGAVLSLFRQAETFGLTGEAAKQAVKDAIGLAEATDGEAGAMLRLTQAMAKGDVQGAMLFSRLVRQLRGVKNEQEFVERYTKLVNAGLEAQGEIAGTTGGQLEKMKQEFGGILKEAGAVVSLALMPLARGLRDLIAWFKELPPWVLKSVTYLIMTVTALEALKLSGLAVIPVIAGIVKGIIALGAALLTTPAGWVALGLGVVALGSIAAAFAALQPKIAAFNKEMEKSAKLGDYVAKRFQTAADEGLAKHKGTPGEEKYLRDSIKLIEDQIKSSETSLNELKRKSEGIGKSLASIFAPSSVKAQEEAFAAQQRQIDAMTKALQKYKAALSSLTTQGVLSPELAKALDEFEQKLLLEYKSFGKTADEIERYKLTLMGIPDAKLVDSDWLAMLNEGNKVTEQFMTKQEKQAREQERIEKLFLKGAISAETYDRAIRSLTESTTDLTKANAALKGSAQDIEVSMRYQHMLDEMNKRPTDSTRPAQGQERTRDVLERIEKNTREALIEKQKRAKAANIEEP